VKISLRDVVLPLPDFALNVTFDTTAEATAIYGPSGSGKTSVIEMIAGLRRPKSGSIALDGTTLFDATTNVPPRERRIGYVPQDDTLFPHLSVRRNILYGAGDAPLDKVAAALEITHVLDRGIRGLSGGERKRVALARALMSAPRLLLLDEPLAGVDPDLGGRILDYLRRIRTGFSIPMLYVTHDMDEAASICEEIVVLDRGRVVSQRAIGR
jgi:molybdate transport system ATP-binding protein